MGPGRRVRKKKNKITFTGSGATAAANEVNEPQLLRRATLRGKYKRVIKRLPSENPSNKFKGKSHGSGGRRRKCRGNYEARVATGKTFQQAKKSITAGKRAASSQKAKAEGKQ